MKPGREEPHQKLAHVLHEVCAWHTRPLFIELRCTKRVGVARATRVHIRARRALPRLLRYASGRNQFTNVKRAPPLFKLVGAPTSVV